MVPAGGSADVAAETLVKLVNNRKKNKRRARGDPGACSDHVESPSSSCHLRLSWLCVQIRAGRRIADMKKPRRGFPHRKSGLPDLRTQKTDLGQARDRRTLREFQFHE
jgi:hypothetical protein